MFSVLGRGLRIQIDADVESDNNLLIFDIRMVELFKNSVISGELLCSLISLQTVIACMNNLTKYLFIAIKKKQ